MNRTSLGVTSDSSIEDTPHNIKTPPTETIEERAVVQVPDTPATKPTRTLDKTRSRVERFNKRMNAHRRSISRMLRLVFKEKSQKKATFNPHINHAFSAQFERSVSFDRSISESSKTSSNSMGRISLKLHYNDGTTSDLNERTFKSLNDIADIISLSSDEENLEDFDEDVLDVPDLYSYYNPYKQVASSTGYNFVLYDIPEEDCDDDDESFVEILKI